MIQYTSSLQELIKDNHDGLQEQERKANASQPRIINQYTHADKEEKTRMQVSFLDTTLMNYHSLSFRKSFKGG